MEIRNNASTGTANGTDLYLVQTNNNQFWGQKATKTIEGPSGTGMSIPIATCGATYVMRKMQKAETAADGHWTNKDEANVVGLACWTFRCAGNTTIDYEVRISLYEGEYTGPYKPYSGPQLYATNTELKVTNDAVDVVVQETKEVRDSVDTAQESADNAMVAADSANAAAAQAQADIDAQVETIGKHFTFSTNGLAISNKGDSSGANILLDESKLTFRNGTDELAYAQGTTFKAPTMEADEMHLGNWMWVHRNNGNLSLK